MVLAKLKPAKILQFIAYIVLALFYWFLTLIRSQLSNISANQHIYDSVNFFVFSFYYSCLNLSLKCDIIVVCFDIVEAIKDCEFFWFVKLSTHIFSFLCILLIKGYYTPSFNNFVVKLSSTITSKLNGAPLDEYILDNYINFLSYFSTFRRIIQIPTKLYYKQQLYVVFDFLFLKFQNCYPLATNSCNDYLSVPKGATRDMLYFRSICLAYNKPNTAPPKLVVVFFQKYPVICSTMEGSRMMSVTLIPN